MADLTASYIANNYQKTSALQYSHFGTRELSFLKISATNVTTGSASNVDFTQQSWLPTGTPATFVTSTNIDNANYGGTASATIPGGGSTGAYIGFYQDGNSYLSKALKALQQYAEIYYVGAPATTTGGSGVTSFVVAVALQTEDTSSSGVNTEDGTYGQMSAAITAELTNAVGSQSTYSSSAGLITAVGYNGAVTIAAGNFAGVSFS